MEDPLQIRLLSSRSPLERGVDGVLEVLRCIDAHGGPLAPDHVYDKRLVPYSLAAVAEMLATAARARRIYVRLLKSRDPEVSFVLEAARHAQVPMVLRIEVPLGWIAEEPESRSRVVVELTRALASATTATIGWAHPKADVVAPPRGAPYQLEDAHWLDVFGADLIDQLGGERVESTPVVVRDPIPGGGVLHLTRSTPLDVTSDAAREAQARAFAHLTGAAEIEVLARLRERSRRLVPVEKRFDPQIADLAEHLLSTEIAIDRSREIERWNRFHPPTPSEQRAVGDQPPPDVDDVGDAIRRYQTLYAEQLMALLEPHLPDVVRAEASCLPAIDAHVYRADYPRHFERRHIDDDLVPAVGGFLGLLLVQHLGGRWSPRVRLDETAVIVGDRAWLPFLRARNYLASKDSALTHSLTQLFSVAAR
jgi:hypothetical protein